MQRELRIRSVRTLFGSKGVGSPITGCPSGVEGIVLIVGRLQIGSSYIALLICHIVIRKAEAINSSVPQILPIGERIGVRIKVNTKANSVRDHILFQSQGQCHGLTGGYGFFIRAHGDRRYVFGKGGGCQTQHDCQCQQHRNQFFHIESFPPLIIWTFRPEIR